MKYVMCVNNKTLALDELDDDYGADLVVGQVYKLAPPEANDGPNRLRVIDGSGDDYLYPASYFVPLRANGERVNESITVHLPPHVKGILHAEAVAAHKSVSALLREWIDEHLDLPEPV
ncbi:MAG: hypothetical protein R3A44_36655 [Caldilineaceae bacterium]